MSYQPTHKKQNLVVKGSQGTTSLGATDNFNNLCILHKEIHKLVHATQNETIITLKKLLRLSSSEVEKVNKLRKMSNLELID